MKKLTIGTRGSLLALWQANFIKDALQSHYKDLEVELQIVKTKGDKILDVPLAKIGGKGLFTKELEELLLNGTIDLAVHSLKDVPIEMPKGLELSAICKRENPQDALLSIHYTSLQSLPPNSKVGTTSLRRSMQLKALRKDIDTQSLRGNVQTRLQKLQDGEFNAIVLAQAGLNRLGIKEGDFHITPLDIIPAMGQGALGIQCLEKSQASEVVKFLNDTTTLLECTCERAFIKVLQGGCQVPIGAHATFRDEILALQVILGLPNGEQILQDSNQALLKNALIEENLTQAIRVAQSLGETIANRLIARGAREILAQAAKFL